MRDFCHQGVLLRRHHVSVWESCFSWSRGRAPRGDEGFSWEHTLPICFFQVASLLSRHSLSSNSPSVKLSTDRMRRRTNQTEALGGLVREGNLEAFKKAVAATQLTPSTLHGLFHDIISEIDAKNRKTWLRALATNARPRHARHKVLEDEVEALGFNAARRPLNEVEVAQKKEKMRTDFKRAKMICFPLIKADRSLIESKSEPPRWSNIIHVAAEKKAYMVIRAARKRLAPDEFRKLILELDYSGENALTLAVVSKSSRALREMLHGNREVLRGENGIKLAIEKAIEKGHTKALKILQAEAGDSDIHYDMLSSSIRAARPEIFGYLSSLKTHDPKMTGPLLHEAVKKDQLQIVQQIIQLAPDLAATFEEIPDSREARSALRHVRATDDGQKIRDLILPIIFKTSPVAKVRQHLHGISGK